MFDKLANQVHRSDRLVTAAKVLTAGCSNSELVAKLLFRFEADWARHGDYLIGARAAGRFASLSDRLAEHADEYLLLAEEDVEEVVGDQPKVVYTNEPLLALSLQRSGRLPNVTVFYIVQEDQRFELERLANPHVGQREALWKAMEPNAYGRPIRPDALRPDTVPLGAVFALTKDARLPLVMPPQRWAGKLEVVRPGYDAMISLRVEEARKP